MKDTVPKVGLEPTRPLGTMDFESIAAPWRYFYFALLRSVY